MRDRRGHPRREVPQGPELTWPWERERGGPIGGRPLYTERMFDTTQNTEQKVPHAECKQPVPRGINYARMGPEPRWALPGPLTVGE